MGRPLRSAPFLLFSAAIWPPSPIIAGEADSRYDSPPLDPTVPRRDDIKKILLIGSGPIVIGQACEFDYSGTQACKALREEGYEVVLVNSNPATIMTDPGLADATYIEPLTWQIVEKVIEKERPDALLPTLGGQTGPEHGDGSGSQRRAGKIWRRNDRCASRCDRQSRGTRPVQRGDGKNWSGCLQWAHGQYPGPRPAETLKLVGLPAVVRPKFHDGRFGIGDRLQQR